MGEPRNVHYFSCKREVGVGGGAQEMPRLGVTVTVIC